MQLNDVAIAIMRMKPESKRFVVSYIKYSAGTMITPPPMPRSPPRKPLSSPKNKQSKMKKTGSN